MSKWAKMILTGAAVVLLVLGIAASLRQANEATNSASDLREAQLSACERVNDFRTVVSDANEGFVRHNDITAQLFATLAAESADPKTRRAFQQAVPVYEHITHFYRDIEQVDCKAVIPKK